MPSSMLSLSRSPARLAAALLAALAIAAIPHERALAAALPAPPKTFDTSYAPPSGKTWPVAAGGNLQAALDQAQLGDTIALEAGATFTGRFTLPNKTTGTGWIYVVSSKLASLPAAGQRVAPSDAVNMPKIMAKPADTAIVTVANSNHFRFVGIEFATTAGALSYQLINIGNGDTSPATLPNNIIFDRCYIHGDPAANNRRGIMMNGAYVAVVDSYISDFQEAGADSQTILSTNTTGPLQIRNNYLEAAGENIMFGGADSKSPALVPADIELRNNHFFKPLSLLQTKNTIKNLLEFKAGQRVLVIGNTFENNPLSAQSGFAILITPRNNGSAPWAITSDIEFNGNTLINVGSGFNVAGLDNFHVTQMTERVLIHDNLVGVTGLNKADGRAFQFIAGGGDYTVDHNTVINSALPPATPGSTVGFAESKRGKITNFVFTNNLATFTSWGFFGSGAGEGTKPLNTYFTDWTFSKNVLVNRPAADYPAGNFFPTNVTAVRFANVTGGNYTLAVDSPYKNAGTDGTDIGANLGSAQIATATAPNPPSNVVVK